jgi:hypothetical protein
MSLDYELGNIAHYKEVCYDGKPGERKMSAVTHALIFVTMSVDIGKITEKNYREFYSRTKFVFALHGSTLVTLDDNEEYKYRDFTLAEVKAHIGLHTNVHDKTHAHFVKSHIDRYFRELNYQTQRSEERETLAA